MSRDLNVSTVVTACFLDGRTKVGRITGFAPHQSDLILDVGAAGGHAVRIVLPCEQLSYLGFHHGEAPRQVPAAAACVRRRIHLAGSRALTVEVEEQATGSRLGFFGRPIDVESPFQEIFFYTGGVNAIENDEQLASLLVQQGVVPAPELRRGLEEHASRQSCTLGQILVEQHVVAPDALEKVASTQARGRLRLGEVLVEQGLASLEQVAQALSEQKRRHSKRLGEVLVELEIVSERDLATVLARKFNLPFVDLDGEVIDPAAVSAVPGAILLQHGILPLRMDQRSLTVAIGDPMVMEGIDQIRHHTRKRVVEVVATPAQIRARLQALAVPGGGDPGRSAGEVTEILRELDVADEVLSEEPVPEAVAGPSERDSAVIRLANQIIIDAVHRGASDIHLEPNGAERSALIRFRIDGECVPYQEIPPGSRLALVARLKIMAQLDIAEKRKPQDGKIRLRLRQGIVELRVATVPTVNGNEDMVLRILAASRPLPLDQMGLSPRNLDGLRAIIARPFGLVLCVGPTGSGKTTTLHSALGAINRPDTKIWTAEDPVEITQPGLRQVQVNARIGFTFAAAMRAFLRADPDVIMVGEMRDQETASTAVEASLTGHLVLSTLHTNSAPETITRLLDMGLDPFAFSDSLLGVLAQRLTRALCPACREASEATVEERDAIEAACGPLPSDRRPGAAPALPLRLFRARGCDACGGTGYQGRIALHELLLVDDRIRPLMATRAPVAQIRQAAMEGGMRTLVQDGLDKVIAGRTDWPQVFAVAR